MFYSDRIITAGQGVILRKTAEGNITLTATETTPAGDYTDNNLTGVNVATTKTEYTEAHSDANVFYTLANESGLGRLKSRGVVIKFFVSSCSVKPCWRSINSALCTLH